MEGGAAGIARKGGDARHAPLSGTGLLVDDEIVEAPEGGAIVDADCRSVAVELCRIRDPAARNLSEGRRRFDGFRLGGEVGGEAVGARRPADEPDRARV